MITLLIAVLFFIGVNGLALKLACRLNNNWFARSIPIRDKDSSNSPAILPVQQVENYAASGTEQANPFLPPLKVATPKTVNKGPQVVVPPPKLAFAYGALLFGLQVVLSVAGYWSIHFWGGPQGSSLPHLMIVLAYYTATAGLITVLLPSSFTRSLIVTGIFYVLMLVATSPITIFLFVLAHGFGSGW